MKYEVKTEKFTGPLDKLLQLIEEKHLDITQVSLAGVTADFLNYIKGLGEKVAPATLADFLAVAAKLILIKSKVLLPRLELTEEEEGEIHDLEARLKIYREFKVASEFISKIWDKNKISYGRPLLSSLGDQRFFYPPADLKISDLGRTIANLAAALQTFLPETQTVKKVVVTIEQKIEELLNRFKEAGRHSFKSLVQQKSRSEVIVLFLAVLHLLKDRLIKAEQESEFGEITLQNKND